MTSVVINGVTVNRREIDNWINMTQLCKTVKYSPYSRWKNKPDSKKTIEKVAKDLNLTPDQLYKKDGKYPYSPPQIVEEMAKWMGIHDEIAKWIATFPKIENSTAIASQDAKCDKESATKSIKNLTEKNTNTKTEEKEVLPPKSKKKKSSKKEITQNDPKSLNNNEIIKQIESYMNTWLEMDFKEPGGKHVDFDPIWKGIGFNQKNDAKKVLKKQFQEDLDFSGEFLKSTGGRKSEIIKLTVNASKEFCMMANTPNGKIIRRYFIDQENKFRLLKQNILNGNIELKDNKTGEILDTQKLQTLQQENQLLLKEKELTIQNSFLDTERIFISERKRYWQPLLIKYHDAPVNYIASLGIHPIAENQNQPSVKLEIGKTEDWKARRLAHENNFETFDIIGLYKVYSPLQTEREIIKKFDSLGLMTTCSGKKGKSTEVIYTTPEYPASKILEIIREICELPALFDSTRDLEIENIKLKCEIESLKKEKITEIESLKKEFKMQLKYSILLAKKGIDIPDDF